MLVPVVGAGLTGAVIWNLFTWWRGIPSSSSHALVGGLVGAALVAEGMSAVTGARSPNGALGGVIGILIGILIATLLGFGAAWVLERLALRLVRNTSTRAGGPVRGAQWVTSAWLAFSHGANDAQKAVGVIGAMLVATGHATSASETSLGVAGLLGCPDRGHRAGWLAHRQDHRVAHLSPAQHRRARPQAASAGVIFGASVAGAPVSTSQVVSSSVVGIGAGRRRSRHIGWGVVREMGLAWLTTMPAAAIVAVLALPPWRALAGV